MAQIKIILNGEEKSFEQGTTIANLIDILELDLNKIAVERNLEIVDIDNFSQVILNDGDKMEIVHFIGGG